MSLIGKLLRKLKKALKDGKGLLTKKSSRPAWEITGQSAMTAETEDSCPPWLSLIVDNSQISKKVKRSTTPMEIPGSGMRVII